MLDDVIDACKKFVEMQVNSDEEIFVDDYINDMFEDSDYEQQETEALSEYLLILSKSVFRKFLRWEVATEQIIAMKLF